MIIDANDPALAFFFARDTHFQAHKMQAIVLQATNPLWAVLFAAYIPNADIKALQAKVLASNDLQKAVEFACYVPNADVRAVERAVIKAGSAKAAATLLAHSDCASVSALQRTILTRGAPAHLLELARHLRGGKALRQIEDILVAKKAVKHCRLFAQEIKGLTLNGWSRWYWIAGTPRRSRHWLLTSKASAPRVAKSRRYRCCFRGVVFTPLHLPTL